MDLRLGSVWMLLSLAGFTGMVLPVSTGGAFQIMLPLVLTLAGVLFFDEPFTLAQVAGAACILSGGHLTVSEKKR